jgi:hypothetical protein
MPNPRYSATVILDEDACFEGKRQTKTGGAHDSDI